MSLPRFLTEKISVSNDPPHCNHLLARNPQPSTRNISPGVVLYEALIKHMSPGRHFPTNPQSENCCQTIKAWHCHQSLHNSMELLMVINLGSLTCKKSEGDLKQGPKCSRASTIPISYRLTSVQHNAIGQVFE